MREYKEDSTRGSAKVNPKTYKGDTLVQAWLDARQLAVLSVWLDGGGYVTRHLSDLVKITVEEVASKLIDSGMVKKIEYTKEARALLEGKYKAKLNPGGRGERNLIHNLRLDSLRQGIAYKDEAWKGGESIVDEETIAADSKALEERIKEGEERERKQRRLEREQRIAMLEKAVEVKGESSYGKKKVGEYVIDVEENVRKMKEADEKLDEMP